MANSNARYRDSLFRSYFNEPERLLSLCNAVLDTKYDNPDKLNINTLEGIFFDKQKNDISCTIDNHFLVLVEHQTTVNENMPFRCLSYVAELLNNLVKNKNKLYNKGLIKFPKPKFFVLYDGDKREPLQRKMHLSDAFGGDSDSLELVVSAFNINYGLPQPLLQKCRYLFDYSTLVGKVKEGIRLGLSRRDAISHAVKFCLEHGIMGNYLIEHSEEVSNMLALEWNMDDALQARFDEGRDEGIEEVALNMLRDGEPLDKILKFTNLSLERIKELEKSAQA
ncbi:MAG: transposase [Quinella sp. 1Q7]|nr:transposase [Quinella sp. 1Q7]